MLENELARELSLFSEIELKTDKISLRLLKSFIVSGSRTAG